MSKFTFCFLFFLSVYLFVLFSECLARGEVKILGQVGNVYFIAEEDLLDVIRERVARIDMLSLKSFIESRIRSYFEVNNPNVIPAVENRTRILFPVFTLPFDIIDHTGRVIFPKGLSYNVLDYVYFRNVLVFVDFNSEEEVNWLLSSEYFRSPYALIIAVRGNLYDINNKFDRHVYKADSFILEYFQIQRTPSVVQVVGNYFQVMEIGLDRKR